MVGEDVGGRCNAHYAFIHAAPRSSAPGTLALAAPLGYTNICLFNFAPRINVLAHSANYEATCGDLW